MKDLSIYLRKNGDPDFSVIESLNYDFATYKYSTNDFRFEFISEYIKYMREVYSIEVYNCKIQMPSASISFINDFVNFYIFTTNLDNEKYNFRIDDKNDVYVKAFYKILDRIELPGIPEDLKVNFIIQDIDKIRNSYLLKKACNFVNDDIQEHFSEVSKIAFWDIYYICIKSDKYNMVSSNVKYMEDIKQYCFNTVKRWDSDNIISYDKFNIRIENEAIYRRMGQHYFNSDAMFDCILV